MLVLALLTQQTAMDMETRPFRNHIEIKGTDMSII